MPTQKRFESNLYWLFPETSNENRRTSLKRTVSLVHFGHSWIFRHILHLYSIRPVCFDAVCLRKHRQQRQRRHINTYVNGEWQSVQGLRSLQSVVNPAQDRKKREVLCFGFCFPTVVAIPTISGSARLAQLETAL